MDIDVCPNGPVQMYKCTTFREYNMSGLNPIANNKLFLQGSTDCSISCAHPYYVSKVQFEDGLKTYFQSMIKIFLSYLSMIYTKYVKIMVFAVRSGNV
jgi:hypothetical protein